MKKMKKIGSIAIVFVFVTALLIPSGMMTGNVFANEQDEQQTDTVQQDIQVGASTENEDNTVAEPEAENENQIEEPLEAKEETCKLNEQKGDASTEKQEEENALLEEEMATTENVVAEWIDDLTESTAVMTITNIVFNGENLNWYKSFDYVLKIFRADGRAYSGRYNIEKIFFVGAIFGPDDPNDVDWDNTSNGVINFSLKSLETAIVMICDAEGGEYFHVTQKRKTGYKTGVTTWREDADGYRGNFARGTFVPYELYEENILDTNSDLIFANKKISGSDKDYAIATGDNPMVFAALALLLMSMMTAAVAIIVRRV